MVFSWFSLHDCANGRIKESICENVILRFYDVLDNKIILIDISFFLILSFVYLYGKCPSFQFLRNNYLKIEENQANLQKYISRYFLLSIFAFCIYFFAISVPILHEICFIYFVSIISSTIDWLKYFYIWYACRIVFYIFNICRIKSTDRSIDDDIFYEIQHFENYHMEEINLESQPYPRCTRLMK